MINRRVKKRLRKDRAMTAITLRMPEDVVEDLKTMAPRLGFAGYQPLIRAYISEGMRRDERRLYFVSAERLAEALKARGVASGVIDEALTESGLRQPSPER
jgi:hypothetical protein